jgi:nitrate reductase delta subunit
MTGAAVEGQVLQLFATILEYPRDGLLGAVDTCAALVEPENREAAAMLHGFRRFAAATPLGRLEEIYTATFDLNPDCCPYIGYHLFGESYKRSVFMLELKARYSAQHFDIADELPDHLAPLLLFLSRCRDPDLHSEIIREGLLPALDRMTGRVAPDSSDPHNAPSGISEAGPDHPYRGVLEALRLVLRTEEGDCRHA